MSAGQSDSVWFVWERFDAEHTSPRTLAVCSTPERAQEIAAAHKGARTAGPYPVDIDLSDGPQWSAW